MSREFSKSQSGTGVFGRATVSNTGGVGVEGVGGGIGVQGTGSNVGVRALGDAIAVEALVTAGDGVGFLADVSDLGPLAVAGKFVGGGANSAVAISARGPVEFPTASGMATVPSGQSFVVVTTRVPADARILAVLNQQPGISNHATVQCAERLTATSFQIQLTVAPANNVKVAWFLLG